MWHMKTRGYNTSIDVYLFIYIWSDITHVYIVIYKYMVGQLVGIGKAIIYIYN